MSVKRPHAPILAVLRLAGGRYAECMWVSAILRWTGRVVLWAAILCGLVYLADCVVYLLRGEPMGRVTVNQFVSTPLKGDKTEYDFEGSVDEPCAQSLFGHQRLSACWQLRRNPNQGLEP